MNNFVFNVQSFSTKQKKNESQNEYANRKKQQQMSTLTQRVETF